MDCGEDGGGGTAEGFAADDAALGIADHTAGVKDIRAGGNAGGDKRTDNINRIGHGVWQVFDIAIVRVGDGDGYAGSGGEFAVGDGFNKTRATTPKGLIEAVPMLISCGVRLRIWVDMGRYFLSCCAALWLADSFFEFTICS